MSEYPKYVQTMIAGTATLKRVVVADDDEREEDDAPTCCVLSLSEDLETLTFENNESMWELPVKEVSKIIHFDDEASKVDSEYLLGLLVPADRLVVALEFASLEDLEAWSYGMQVLTHKTEEATDSEEEEPEEESVDEVSELQQENELLREALTARDETVSELLALVQTLIKRQLHADSSAPKLANTPRTASVQVLGA